MHTGHVALKRKPDNYKFASLALYYAKIINDKQNSLGGFYFYFLTKLN